MMGFRTVSALFLLIPFGFIVFLYIWSKWKRLRDLHELGDPRLLQSLLPIESLIRRRRKDKGALLAVFFVVIAAAGPQWGSKLKEVKQRGVEVFVCMDTSRSMLAEDVEPSRIERAKRSLSVLVNKLAGNRIGIIAFAKRAVVQCPLTVDAEAASMFLEILDQNTVPEQGTAIGDAIRLALASFPKDDKSGRAIVLLTDGEDHRSDPTGAAEEAKKAGVVIFTIGIGTAKGEVIKNRDDQGNIVEFHKYKGEVVSSQLDEGLLSKIAAITSGQYYRASSTDREIDEIAAVLNGFEKKEFAQKMYERRHDRFQVFLVLALLLLILEFFTGENPGQWKRVSAGISAFIHALRKRRKFSFSILLILLLLAPRWGLADVKSHVRKGNELLRKGDYAGARTEFQSAQIDAPEAAILPYDIAATYYFEGKFDDAKKSYEQAEALTSDPMLKSMIAYNMGHLMFSSGKPDEAVQKFKESLKINPKDFDAKYNIEYIKSGKKPPAPPKGQPKEDQNKKGGQNQQQQQSQADDKKDGEKNKAQEPEKRPGDLSKEDAERVLQMMKDEESEKLKNTPRPAGKAEEKDKSAGGEDW